MNSVPDRVAVIGAGYVGLVTAVGLAGLGHDVTIVEARRDRREALAAGRMPLFEAGLQEAYDAAGAVGRIRLGSETADLPDDALVMICVGTPIGEDGRSDLSQLEGALRQSITGGGDPILVVRSTLPLGTTRQVVAWSGIPSARVFSNPEFLRQGSALEDFLHPERVVIGRFPDADPAALARVTALFAPLEAPTLVVDVAAAELIKNGANAFLALKLSYTNELAVLCEAYGADVDEVLDGITRDPRIGRTYMRPSFGFGGSCLPKELQTLYVAGQAVGLPMFVTRAAADANRSHQEHFAQRIAAALGGLQGMTVALLGLAFKAATDDVRDSPAIAVARLLLARGARVRGYDPEAMANAGTVLPELELGSSAEAILEGADAAVIATEWPAFRQLDWAAARERMARPLVIDGRRLLDPQVMRNLGYTYLVLGSPAAEVPAGIAARRDARDL